MEDQGNDKDILEQNRILRRKLSLCRQQVSLYKQGFLSQEKTIFHQSLDNVLGVLNSSVATGVPSKVAYEKMKDWLLREDFSSLRDSTVKILDGLLESFDDISLVTPADLLSKLQVLQGDTTFSKEDKKAIQKMAILLSLVSAVWENNF